MSWSPRQSASTFLLPAKNASAHVRSSVVSALRAMQEEDRLVIIDDGSDDGTAAIISSVVRADSRVIVLSNKSTTGVARSLNLALGEVETEFVARIDADDICLPWRLSLSKKKIKNLDVDLLFTGAILFGSGMRFAVPSPGLSIPPQKMGLKLASNNPLIHSTLFARTSALRALGGYKEDTKAEDYDLWIRAHLGGFRLAKIVQPTILFRVHERQLTRSEDWKENYIHPRSRDALRVSLGLPRQDSPNDHSRNIPRVRRLISKFLFRV